METTLVMKSAVKSESVVIMEIQSDDEELSDKERRENSVKSVVTIKKLNVALMMIIRLLTC